MTDPTFKASKLGGYTVRLKHGTVKIGRTWHDDHGWHSRCFCGEMLAKGSGGAKSRTVATDLLVAHVRGVHPTKLQSQREARKG